MFSCIVPVLLVLLLPTSMRMVGGVPNILFILADDLGYNDVSWHNPDIFSPNLETLGQSICIWIMYSFSHWPPPRPSVPLVAL